jgi:hypothetical protein
VNGLVKNPPPPNQGLREYFLKEDLRINQGRETNN